MRRIIAVVALMAVASCGGDSGGGPAGEQLFASAVLGGQAGCVTCHSLDPDRVVVGPSLAGVGERAATRVPGQSAREYLPTSIVMPDSHAVDGFDSGRMPSNWGAVLTGAEISVLVDYLEDL
ncbi:MAG: cytochrome c [Acidimicrobiia bacterium]|nr:cytochrome c [Acidimicrobiia bacterium]